MPEDIHIPNSNTVNELLYLLQGIVEQADAQYRSGDMYCTLGKSTIKQIKEAIKKAKGE